MPERPRVLIVDDDPDVGKSFQVWLKGEGFKAFTAGSGEAAREIVKNEGIAVCLVDMHLRNEDGLRLGAELHAMDARLKVIVITGYPTYESAIDAMKTGIFDYISKSTDNDAILRKIQTAIRASEQERARQEQEERGKAGIILVGHHLLVREGLENFFKEGGSYRLLRTFHAFDYIKKTDFDPSAAVLLICATCNQHFLETPEKVLAHLKLVFPNARTVIINCDCDDDRKRELIRWGAKGFLPANIGKPTLRKALDCILGGQIWVSRELSTKLLSELLEDTRPEIVYRKPSDSFNLTGREIEILKALASGLSNKAISEKLFLSEKTVKTHTHHIFQKMSVKTRTQAVMKAMEHHII